VGTKFVAIHQDGDGDTTPPVITPIITGTQGLGAVAEILLGSVARRVVYDATAGTVAVTVAYALGAAIPMLAVAALGQRATSRIRANAPALRMAFGVVMAAAALALVFNADQKLQTWFPDYTHALQGLERSSVARKELAQLQHRGPSPFTANRPSVISPICARLEYAITPRMSGARKARSEP